MSLRSTLLLHPLPVLVTDLSQTAPLLGVKTLRPPNRLAAVFLRAFPRWLRAPQAHLHDPALVRFVTGLERKVWSHLLGEVRRLGARVVHASATRLLLATDKPTRTEANHYAQFLGKTLTRKRPLFCYMGWELRGVYSAAIWRDSFNWAAMPDEAGEPMPQFVWNLTQFVAASMRPLLHLLLADFLVQLASLPPPEAAAEALAAANDPQHDKRGTSGYSLLAEWSDARRDALSKPQHALLNHVTQRALEAVQDAMRLAGDPDPEESQGAGQILTLLGETSEQALSPQLRFVKILCHILGLFAPLEGEIGLLKRTLLKLVDVREFAPESDFVEPSRSFPLEAITCAYCNDVRDVDLLRDPSMLSHPWRCPSCRHTIAPGPIETRLVAQVRTPRPLSLTYPCPTPTPQALTL